MGKGISSLGGGCVKTLSATVVGEFYSQNAIVLVDLKCSILRIGPKKGEIFCSCSAAPRFYTASAGSSQSSVEQSATKSDIRLKAEAGR